MSDQPHRIWDPAGQDEKVSYLKEMVSHPVSVYGGLSALMAGAILSIPLGLGFGAIPLLTYAAAEGIAALFVPDSPVFRDTVNRRKRKERREQARAHMLEELQRRGSGEHWEDYQRMVERLDSLREMVRSGRVALTAADLDRLDDSTLDFLGLWLARLVMRERFDSVDENRVRGQIRTLKQQLEQELPPVEERRLRKALEDLERILERRQGLRARAAAVEAAMLSMSDTFGELYQRLTANPNASELGSALNDAVERLRVEEQLDLAVGEELDSVLHARGRARQTTA